MRIDVKSGPGEMLAIYSDGKLVAEAFGGVTQGPDDLLGEVHRSRWFQHLPLAVDGLLLAAEAVAAADDHVNKTAEKRRSRFVEGFIDGLRGRKMPHPGGVMVPPIRPAHDPAYVDGYDAGERILRCLIEARVQGWEGFAPKK